MACSISHMEWMALRLHRLAEFPERNTSWAKRSPACSNRDHKDPTKKIRLTALSQSPDTPACMIICGFIIVIRFRCSSESQAKVLTIV